MDFSYVDDVLLQQQLHDLVYYTQTQKRHKMLPRVDSVRFIRIGSPGPFVVSIDLVMLKKNPESFGRAEQRVDVAIRVPARFPAELPLIACTLGAENLPPGLKQNGQLVVPWLQQHEWPVGYSLSLFVSELCTALNGSLGELAACAEPVHPVPSQQMEEFYATAPQFATEQEQKGKSVQLVQLIKDQFAVGSEQQIVLKEFFSSQLGTIINTDEDFKVIKPIGIGSSCRVYLANWRGSDVAVKVFTGVDPRAVEKEFGNEVDMMNRLGCHPSLVLFLGVCPNPLGIVFEYLPFSLFELINGVKEPDRKIPPFPKSWTKRVTMMLDLAKGLQFLHSFDIIHRNLLVTQEGRVKLADFGISRVAKSTDLMTGCCGTFQWMAPEVIVSEKYSISADIYSFGVILWEICEGAAPFADLAPGCVPIAVVKEKRRPRLSSVTPPALQGLIQSCWQDDAAKRPTAAVAVKVIQSFFPAA
ncbi:hypothetical protein Gpo141_00000109 [Globisporangium polare]